MSSNNDSSSSPSNSPRPPRYNVTVVGTSQVGKTQLLQRHRYNLFDARHLPTLGIEYMSWMLRDNSMQLGVWDAGGDPRFQSISLTYAQNAHVIVFVFDVNEYSTFRHVKELASGFTAMGIRPALKILVGNKVDCGQRQVSDGDIDQFKQHFDIAAFYPVSAKTGAGVEVLWAGIGQLLRDRCVETKYQSTTVSRRPTSATMSKEKRRSPAKRALSFKSAALSLLTCGGCIATTSHESGDRSTCSV